LVLLAGTDRIFGEEEEDASISKSQGSAAAFCAGPVLLLDSVLSCLLSALRAQLTRRHAYEAPLPFLCMFKRSCMVNELVFCPAAPRVPFAVSNNELKASFALLDAGDFDRGTDGETARIGCMPLLLLLLP
jgi:hypothetical protein